MSFRKILKGASFLSAAEVVSQGCALLRNIILARFLAKADFGVAALLATILTAFEMSGKMALGQQIVQSKHANVPSFIDSVHFTQLTLSTLSAILILLFAWPLANFFADPKYVSAIMSLALIPFINGFTNLELYRQTRQLNFVPQVITDTIPQIVTTLAAWPLALFFRDYHAVIYLLIGKAVIYCLMTHLMGERRFRPKYNAQWLRENLQFGWPLLLAGFVQLGNFQGDSMVVAASYTLAQLGEFSVAFTIAMAPSLVLLRVCHSVSLPLLVEVQNDISLLGARYGRYVEIMALLACFATLGMAFCGEQLVVLLFGAKYSGIGALACFLTAAQGLRIVRGATVGAAMAKGDTLNNLISSVWRLSGLLLAVIVGILHGSLTWFAFTAVGGELIALSVSVIRLSKKHSIPPSITLKPTILGIGCVIMAITVKWITWLPNSFSLNCFLLFIAVVFSTGAFLLCFPPLRAMVSDFSHRHRTRQATP